MKKNKNRLNPGVKFYTLGCKVNQYDTQYLREQFAGLGFLTVNNHQGADVCVINTCTVTARADRASLNLILRVKKENPRATIVVTGCLVDADKSRVNALGNIIALANKDKAILAKAIAKRISLGSDRLQQKLPRGISTFYGHTRAFVKIEDGCDNFCSFCKVPYVRGRVSSRPLPDIVAEARRLAENGFKEIVLTGISLGSYGKDSGNKISLVSVLDKLETIAGILRIRLSSIEAADVSRELISRLETSRKICRHLHIPLQSADDSLLKAMNRKYTRASYAALIGKLKRQIPEIAITTDVLVGFPSESENNFKNTLTFIKDICPLKVHIFPYSQRPGTLAAAQFKQQLAPELIKQRVAILKKVEQVCSRSYRRKFLNRQMPVLFESVDKLNPRLWFGYTDNYIKVHTFSSESLRNQQVPVTMQKIFPDYVQARLVRCDMIF